MLRVQHNMQSLFCKIFPWFLVRVLIRYEYTLLGISFVTETCRLFPFEMYLAHNLIKCYKTVNGSKTEDFYV